MPNTVEALPIEIGQQHKGMAAPPVGSRWRTVGRMPARTKVNGEGYSRQPTAVRSEAANPVVTALPVGDVHPALVTALPREDERRAVAIAAPATAARVPAQVIRVRIVVETALEIVVFPPVRAARVRLEVEVADSAEAVHGQAVPEVLPAWAVVAGEVAVVVVVVVAADEALRRRCT